MAVTILVSLRSTNSSLIHLENSEVREQKSGKNPILSVLHLFLFLEPWRVPSYTFCFYYPFPIAFVQLCVIKAKLWISICISVNKGFLKLILEEKSGLFLYFFSFKNTMRPLRVLYCWNQKWDHVQKFKSGHANLVAVKYLHIMWLKYSSEASWLKARTDSVGFRKVLALECSHLVTWIGQSRHRAH